MIVQYIAKDGKIFEDESDCLEYEDFLRIVPYTKDIKFFTKNLEKYPLDLDILYNPYEKCNFIVFATQEAAEIFSDLMGEYGYFDFPNEKGVYYFDNDENNFMNMGEKVDEMKKFIEEYEKLLKMIKED